ncbi:MAG: DNA polymerase/3'-5' exonuclease PolX [Gemmatimonadales bacterium]|nr:MAG: DNA polymerase/3'-5' exonuclease PolX [Gemmatimonadales bacterium]
MENIEIADRLNELADLLEIKGANPFRIRAYRNAVRTVGGLTRPLVHMVRDGEDLTELPGIGKDMDSHIRELLATGELEMLAEVTAEVPRELAVLTRLDGVGPKKARKIWKELGITTPEELEVAVEDGRVEALEGFGARSATKILRSIEDLRKQQGRFLRLDARQLLRGLLEHLEEAPELERLEVAGSYRRGKETVGDLDLLALCDGGEDDRQALMDRFTGYSEVDRVEMSGATRGSVVLRSGLPIDLRILGRSDYGAALHYFTGSKEHNVELRKRAQRRGLKVSEYGVFRVPEGTDADRMEPGEGERVAGETEEEVFAAVDLPWIPPALRENRGEIQAAEGGELPELVTVDRIRGDLHMHSTWSDGKASIAEMARACRDRGYEYLAITDHSQDVTIANGLTPERVREQWDEIERVREEVDGIHLFRGCEVDILKDGSLDLPDDVLEGLDIVLVAVHSHMGLSRDAQTERVLAAIRHPLVDILVHPTGRLLNRREPYPIDIEAILEAAGEHEVAVELNANPRRLDLHDRHLFRARELGLPISVATDAHRESQLDFMEPGLEQARRGWVGPDHVLNCRSLDDLTDWLDRRS